jgi:hypothetical protein
MARSSIMARSVSHGTLVGKWLARVFSHALKNGSLLMLGTLALFGSLELDGALSVGGSLSVIGAL